MIVDKNCAPTDSSYLRFLAGAAEQLDGIRDEHKALITALRLVREAFDADEACIARRAIGRSEVELSIRIPSDSTWDLGLLSGFLEERRPRMPAGLLVAPLERRGRRWAVLATRRRSGAYARDSVRDIGRVAEQVSRAIERLERARINGVRERIDRKIQEQLRPRDLFYQILHGLRSLTNYDHSAAVLTLESGADVLELVAEQVNWRKGKSLRVGQRFSLEAGLRAFLEHGEVRGFDLSGDAWREWNGRGLESLAAVLDYNQEDAGEQREACMLCAPLSNQEGTLGVLKISACHPGSMGAYEAELVQGFSPQAAVAIRNLARATSLEIGMLEAHKKHAMADLARGVSHDVNNAFGSVLPLVQQMRAELSNGALDPAVFDQDLAQIESSVQTCRRIFGGMLSFARGAAQGDGAGNLRRAIEGVLSILQESMRRSGVSVEVDLEEPVPLVRGSQGDLEQLLLNLSTNARDAMPRGGQLRIEVQRVEPEQISLRLCDTGLGIAPEHLSRIEEPFFTTKAEGTGLGLSICRSIVHKMRGRLSIESQLGAGTQVSLLLPTVDARIPGEES